jgi:type VI protein secretion system component VasK
MSDQDSEQEWQLSKSVPLTLVLAVACQTIALIWFVATLRNDINTNKNNIIRIETRTETLEKLVNQQAVTMGRMDENIKAIRQAVEKMASR